MDHAAHEPGTVADCPACRAFAYEPGWYRSLRFDQISDGESLVILDGEPLDIQPVDVALPEAQLIEVVLPDLQNVRNEDEDR